jgi:hypothetical protein
MTPKQRLVTPIAGTVGVAICCFTPLLAITLAAVGLGRLFTLSRRHPPAGAGDPHRGHRTVVPAVRPCQAKEVTSFSETSNSPTRKRTEDIGLSVWRSTGLCGCPSPKPVQKDPWPECRGRRLPDAWIRHRGHERCWRRRAIVGAQGDHCRGSGFTNRDAVVLALAVPKSVKGLGACRVEGRGTSWEVVLQHDVRSSNSGSRGRCTPRRDQSAQVPLVVASTRINGFEHRELCDRRKTRLANGFCAANVLSIIAFQSRTTSAFAIVGLNRRNATIVRAVHARAITSTFIQVLATSTSQGRRLDGPATLQNTKSGYSCTREGLAADGVVRNVAGRASAMS